jgi:ribonucleoside-diphosphate reductase alpha chain
VSGLGPNKVLSVPDAIGIAIEKWMQEKNGIQQDLLGAAPAGGAAVEQVRTISGSGAHTYQVGGMKEEQFIGTCPDCGSQLEFAEGCVKCHVCGYSECG